MNTGVSNQNWRPDFWLGVMQSWPMIINAVLFGMVFGIIGREAGVSAYNIVAMNGLVNAGSSQLIALSMWSEASISTIAMMTLLVNLRHILMSMTIANLMPSLMTKKGIIAAHMLTDGTWSVAMRELQRRPETPIGIAYIFGSGISILIPWLVSAYLGYSIGKLVPDYHALGLDFFSAISFSALLGGMWHGNRCLLPWACACVLALAISQFLPLYWSIPIAAIIGAFVGAMVFHDE